MDEPRTLNHSKWECKYHVVLDLQGVDFVEVEAGMNPGNTHHVPFESLKSYHCCPANF